MSLVDRWKSMKEAERRELNQRVREGNDQSEIDEANFRRLADAYDIENITTNGYVYQFIYRDKVIHLVNQTDRICGDYWNKGEYAQDELEILDDMSMLKHKDQSFYRQACAHFGFKDFGCIDGDFICAVEKLLRMVK